MKWTTWAAASAAAMIGIGLMTQPHRFAKTPSYANLLHITHAPVWGVLYLIVAVLLLTWGWRLAPAWWGIAVHTLAVMLFLGWLGAFVVRWFTDDATTIVNVASWTIFVILLIESGMSIVDKPVVKKS